MNRKEFMEELEMLLHDISDSEREEALQYYNDYFDDAGAENEEAIMKELGTPGNVARMIRQGLAESAEDAGEYSEHGYTDPRFRDKQEMTRGAEKADQVNHAGAGKSNGWKIACLILLGILFLPIILPLGIVAAVFVLGILLTAAIGVITAVFISILFFVLGLICVGMGIFRIFTLPVLALPTIGTGLILFGGGLLGILILAWIFVKVIPWLIRGLVKLLSLPFQKRRNER